MYCIQLRQKSIPVTLFDEELKQLASDMLKTMHAEKGVGIAAPQVGGIVLSH
jgi:peptide deformylase